MVDVSWVAVIVAAVVGIIIGMIWYSPSVFGRSWMKLSGMDTKKIQKAKQSGKMGKSMIGMIVATLIMVYVLAVFIGYAGATTISAGAMIGFWVWLGFVATTMSGMVLWEGKPTQLYYIHTGHYLVSLLVMGAILAAWA